MSSLVDAAERLAALMATYAHAPAIQATQTRYRATLVDTYGIEPGMKVLEIGCGQGDTTAVLAEAVGPQGLVVATDPASAGYGAPVSVGESLTSLAEGPLAGRIDARLGFDLHSASFATNEFDVVVLAHCSWYFPGTNVLYETFETVREWARKLVVTEWDLRPANLDQLAHLSAVLLQDGLVTAGLRGDGNVQTPISQLQMTDLVEASGWKVNDTLMVDTSGLQDADWEIALAPDTLDAAVEQGDLPSAALTTAQGLLDVMESVQKASGNAPLPAYTLLAS